MSVMVRRSQPLEALEDANAARARRKAWKVRMGGMPRRLAWAEAARVLRDDPLSVGSLPIHAFLTSIPELADTKAQRMLTDRAEGWYIWPFRRVRDLTDRQRLRLAELLEAGR